MKTANLAIVFTDIKGFTERTSRQTLEENERLLATHDGLLRPIFQSFGGRIVKSIGDAFLVTFESPTQAVLAGVALQDRLWIHNRELPEADRLHVRVAVNAGEVRVESRDVFGEPVNIAARVEGIAEAGEVYFTESVYLSMNKAEVPAAEVGHFELKGIPGKIRVFKVPHAPYRVEPAAEQEPGAAPRPLAGTDGPGATALGAGELPPFGNMGLSRMPQTGELRAAMEGLGPTAQALAKELRRVPWRDRRVLFGAGAVALVLLVIFLAGLSSGVDRAIRAAGDAPASQRNARTQEAEALIAQLEDPGDRAFKRAELAFAIGRTDEAMRRFAEAAQAGSAPARDALIDLLGHPKCDVRSDAAGRLGQLKAKQARRGLQRLADRGGSDDQEGKPLLGGLFGCNSKDAAARALQRLE